MTDKLPPCSIEAEEALLGCILFDPMSIRLIREGLPVEAFFVTAHQSIYKAMRYLDANEQNTDLIAVSTYLSDRNTLEDVGGLNKLTMLLNKTISGTNIDRYASLILEKYKKRKLIQLSTQILDLARDNYRSYQETCDLIRSKLPEEITEGTAGTSKVKITKAKYTVASSSKLHKIELEADIEDDSNLVESIVELKDKAQSMGEELWSEYIATRDRP